MPLFVDLVPSRAHLDERLVQGLGPVASALGPTTLTVDELVSSLHAALLPTLGLAPPVLERLVVARSLRAVLERAAGGNSPSSIQGHAHALESVMRHGLSPVELEGAVAELPDDDHAARERLLRLAELLRETDRAFDALGVVPAAALEARLATALGALGDGAELPWPLGPGARIVRARSIAGLDPSRVALFAAMARALGARGGRVDVQLVCEPRRERMPVAIDRALRALEAIEDAPLELSFALRDPDAPAVTESLVALGEALSVGGRVVGAPVELCEAEGPDEEARWVAARVERWLADGFAPHEIAVVLRDGEPGSLGPVARALDDARIPWRDECGATLASSTLARAALSLPSLVARGAPRDELFHALGVLLGHGPSRPGRPAPFRVAGALRTLRIETLFDPTLDARLAEAPSRAVGPELVHEVLALRDGLRALADEAPVATHAARLASYLDALGGRERYRAESHAVMAGASYDPGAQAILRAIARDEAALGAVATLLREVATHGPRALGDGAIDAATFARALGDATEASPLPSAGREIDGVRVVPARAAVGRASRAVAIVGINDGGFPARPGDDAPLGDAERRAVLRATGRLLERAGGREDETLLFLAVVACAGEALALSGARHDVGGRALPASPFMVDARRATGAQPLRIHRDPLARSAVVPPRGPERAMRAWVQQRAIEAPAALAPTIRSVHARAAIERERREYFAGIRAEPGRYSGRLDHDRVAVEALDLAHWASAGRPLSVTTLERAARCGFRAFTQSVLGLGAPEEPALTIDARGRGHLLHALVEAGQLALRASLAAEPAARLAAVGAALDQAGRDFAASEPHADPDLLRADLLAIRRQVEAFLLRRMDARERWELVATEVAFGPREAWPALEIAVEGQDAIVLQGRIDGVERMDDELRAVEFKSGRGDGFRKRLREGVLDTQFQLVVYAAALSRAADAGRVDARRAVIDGVYVGFRDQSEHTLRDALEGRAQAASDAPAVRVEDVVRRGARGEGALGDAVRRAVMPIRQGVFGPRPRDCEFCDASALCRIERYDGGADE